MSSPFILGLKHWGQCLIEVWGIFPDFFIFFIIVGLFVVCYFCLFSKDHYLGFSQIRTERIFLIQKELLILRNIGIIYWVRGDFGFGTL